MKKGFFTTEFVAILLFFVLPPIVFPQTLPQERVAGFSWMTFALAALAGGLWWQIRKNFSQIADTDGKVRFFLDHGQILVTFGALVVCAGVFEVIARFLMRVEDTVRLLPPSTVLGWVNVGTGTVCAAFYEEVLYRAYVPYALKTIFTAKKNEAHARCALGKPVREVVCEAVAVVLFALAHRYAGWLSVANAAVGGVLLRWCFCKTRRLWTNVTAHAAYNAVMLALQFLMA